MSLQPGSVDAILQARSPPTDPMTTIVFALFPRITQLDFTGPHEVLWRLPGARCVLASATGGVIDADGGLCFDTQPLAAVEQADVLLVPGGFGVIAAMEDPVFVAQLKRLGAGARVVASVCTGSLALAAAGLLQGRRAACHWAWRDLLSSFDGVTPDPGRVVHDGPVWTSAGITAGIDLALALISHDLGDTLSRQVAQQLVVYHRRPGGQSQFSALLDIDRPQGRFSPLLDHVRSHLADAHGVPELAAHACMSPRHFARAFVAETGCTPARAVERLRVEAARAALDSGAASGQQVARDCGFGAAERMRRAFVRLTGQPPAAARRRASSFKR